MAQSGIKKFIIDRKDAPEVCNIWKYIIVAIAVHNIPSKRILVFSISWLRLGLLSYINSK